MKKTLDIAKKVLVWLIIVLAVFMMLFTLISVTTVDRADRGIFGYKAFIVLSDSMSATDFKAGDLILVKEVKDLDTLKEGDIISYTSVNPENYGKTVTHKIRKKTIDADGCPGFITYGTTTGTNDAHIVNYNFVIGKYQFRIPGMGNFFVFLKTAPGYILCVFLPFLILIVLQGINSIRLFRQYKQEQMEEITERQNQQKQEMAAERERLEVERAEAQRAMEELLKLKNELAGKTSGENTEDAPGQGNSGSENNGGDI